MSPPFQFQAPVDHYAPTIADVMGRPAQAWARAAENIGNDVGASLNQFMAYKMRQQDPTYQLNAEKLKQLKEDDADNVLWRQAVARNSGDIDKALTDLRSTGDIGIRAAGKAQQQVDAARKSAIDGQDKQLGIVEKQLKLGGQLLRSISDLPEDQRSDAYAKTLPQLKSVVGDQLAKNIPDQYDPAFVDRAQTWGETAQDTVARRRAALDIVREKGLTAKDAREKDDYFTKSTGNWLSTVESQDEWTKALAGAKALGASDETLSKFGPTFSPDAAAKARQLSMTPAERVAQTKGQQEKLGTFEDYLGSYASDIAHKDPADLTAGDKEKAAHRWAQAHKTDTEDQLTGDKRKDLVATVMQYPSVYNDLTPSHKGQIAGDLAKAGFTGFGQPSAATKAANERWYQSEVTKIKSDPVLQLDPKAQQQRLDETKASYEVMNGRGQATAPNPAQAKEGDTKPIPGYPGTEQTYRNGKWIRTK